MLYNISLCSHRKAQLDLTVMHNLAYGFHIVATDPTSDPGREYHEALRRNAQSSLERLAGLPNPNGAAALQGIWQLCEYLDAVDACCIAMDKILYRDAVERLGAFMRGHTSPRTLHELAEKSWAAQTVWHLVQAQQERREQIENGPGLRLVA